MKELLVAVNPRDNAGLLSANKKGPDLSGPICMNLKKLLRALSGRQGLLLLLGGRFLSGLLRSLLCCVLHRL